MSMRKMGLLAAVLVLAGAAFFFVLSDSWAQEGDKGPREGGDKPALRPDGEHNQKDDGDKNQKDDGQKNQKDDGARAAVVVPLDEVPQVVKDAAAKAIEGFTPTEVKKKTKGDKVVYELKGTAAGKPRKVVLTEAGELVKNKDGEKNQKDDGDKNQKDDGQKNKKGDGDKGPRRDGDRGPKVQGPRDGE